MSITATVIILYLGFFAAFGIYLNRNNSTASDWAIGGGSLGISCWLRGCGGHSHWRCRDLWGRRRCDKRGPGSSLVRSKLVRSTFLVGLFFAIPYRRLQVVSVGQVFDYRFGSYRCQWLTSLCVQAEYLVVNIIEPYVIGSIVSGVTGLPFVVGVAIGGFLIVTFTVTGGLKGNRYCQRRPLFCDYSWLTAGWHNSHE